MSWGRGEKHLYEWMLRTTHEVRAAVQVPFRTGDRDGS